MVKLSKDITIKIPKYCKECGCAGIDYLYSDENEHIFRCLSCGAFYCISIGSDRQVILTEHKNID